MRKAHARPLPLCHNQHLLHAPKISTGLQQVQVASKQSAPVGGVKISFNGFLEALSISALETEYRLLQSNVESLPGMPNKALETEQKI